jgi:glyoxylase-like metal-dependent hydrolase (beta-lactamase superfamily II)
MKIGNIELVPLSDGKTWGDGGGAFGLVPKTIWQKLIPCDHQNRVPMVLRCLLIRTPHSTILVETGMGEMVTPEIAEQLNFRLERPQGGLLENLAFYGVSPIDVDIVLLTHLHGDHCGGCTRLIDSRLVPTFPRAQYWIQQQEWDDAHNLNERTRTTYLGSNYDPIEQSGQLHLINGEATVTEGIRLVPAPGHTKGLQVVVVESAGESAIFLGDVALLHWQLERLAWVSAYDIEPNTTIETKRRWQQWVTEHEALIFFQHDPFIIAGKLILQNNRYKVEAVLKDE